MSKYKHIDDRQFTRDWNVYTKTSVLAEKYGVNDRTITRHAARLGLSPRLGPRRPKKEKT